ncbi:MAG: LamG-like jellyroll fold domain-containing protein [Verrucomicrobiota bacterium]
MNTPRNLLNAATLATAIPFLGTAISQASILVNLDPATALYDSDIKGVVNDGGSGPADGAAHLSGIPVLDTPEHSNGFTFNIAFSPTTADLSGTRLLIEIGATSNGSGFYLVNGVPTFVSKQGASDAALPTGLNDTTLNTIAVQSSSGKLLAGTAYSASVSWNHAGTLEVIVAEDGGSPLLNSFAISGAPGNWSGNDTLSVKTLGKVNAGGLSGNNAGNVFGLPFDVDNASNLQGTVSRALFWNASAVTPLTLTSPVVKGFQVTKLPASNQVRLHWNVTEGGLPNPTTLVVRDIANNSVVYTPSGLSGFTDLPAGVTDFDLTATNATGAVTVSSGVEADNSFTTTVRDDDPVAWFRFNESAGTRLLTDSSESVAPHDGALLGSTVTGAGGFIDGAGAFEGGSAVTSNPILNLGTLAAATPHKGFSVETVVRRRAGATGNHVLVSQTDVSGVGRAILGISESGTIYSQVGVATPTAQGAPNVPAERKEADEKLDTDRWAHLVLVVDAGITGTPGTAEIRWYLDGQKIGSTLDGINPDGTTFTKDFVLETSSGNWVIGSGKSLSSEFWKGDVDDVAIYQKLLDDPNGDGDVVDSKVPAHHGSWYAKTAGIISFKGSSAVVSTGGSVTLTVRAGVDVSEVAIDNGVGTVPLVNGVGTVSVSPSATTTYRATATGTGGPYTQDFAVTYQQLTVPVILGFEKTTLPATNQVRLHWRVSAGAFATPVTIALDSGGVAIPNSGALIGFVDVSAAEAANVTLTATNLIGPVSATAAEAAADTAFSAVVRQDQPVAWFRFNEQSGSGLIVDSAENTTPHNGTPLAAPVSDGATGFVDGAATFDGARGIIADKILSLGTVDTGFTIEAIVRAEPVSGGTANRAIVSQLDLNGTGRLIISVDEDGVIRSVLGGGVRKDADTKVQARAWSHLVVVANALTNEIRWYVDGQPAGTSKDGLNPDGTTFDPNLLLEASDGAWTIGVHKTLTGNFWKGQIDEIAVYDTVLDELPLDPDADPNTPATIDTSRIIAHRDAWYSETAGLISAGVSATTIDPGQSTELSLTLGADVTSVTIDNGIGNVQIVNGKATVILNPSVTTTYQITVVGAGGTVITPITITVVIAAPRLASWSRVGGDFILNFEGSPSTTYYVRGSTDLVSYTLDHGTAVTNAAGTGTATITVDPLKPKEFFRLQTAP